MFLEQFAQRTPFLSGDSRGARYVSSRPFHQTFQIVTFE
jgi:hypothetical protein